MNKSAPSWVLQPKHLRLALGELTLKTITLESLVFNGHFTQLEKSADPTLPFREFPPEASVVIIESQPIERPLPAVTNQRLAIRYAANSHRHFYVNLAGPFETYLNKFSSKSRNNLRKKIRKFTDHCGGTLTWSVAKQRDELLDFHRQAFLLSEKTYQARLFGSGLPEEARFCEYFAEGRECRGYLLHCGSAPVAYIFCPIKDGIVYYDYVGHDPEYEAWSPGTVLQYLAFQSLFEEQCFRMFDFTEGEGPHKEFFATDGVPCASLYYFKKSPKNQALIYGLRAMQLTSRTIVTILEKAGIKRTVKRLLRSAS